jgi:hypothetical protein
MIAMITLISGGYAMNTTKLSEDMQKLVEDKFTELDALNHLLGRRETLRQELMGIMSTIGLAMGKRLQSERLGLYATVAQLRQGRLDRSALLALGVSEEIINQATVTRETRPHVRLHRIRPRNNYLSLGAL